MAIPQLSRMLLPVALLLASDSLKSLSPVSWLATAAILAGIAVAGSLMAWRGSSGVIERTLWGLVAGWVLIGFFSAAVLLLHVDWESGPSYSVSWLSVEGATLALAVIFALYASRRLAYGGWFVIGLYLVREGMQATASPGIAMDDLAFRLYIPLALLAYVLMLLWAAVIASTFEGQRDESRRSRVAALAGASALVVVSRAVAFQYVTGFSATTWWWRYADEWWWRYTGDALPAALAKAVDFFVLGLAAVAVYALLRWVDSMAREGNSPRPQGAPGE